MWRVGGGRGRMGQVSVLSDQDMGYVSSGRNQECVRSVASVPKKSQFYSVLA